MAVDVLCHIEKFLYRCAILCNVQRKSYIIIMISGLLVKGFSIKRSNVHKKFRSNPGIEKIYKIDRMERYPILKNRRLVST